MIGDDEEEAEVNILKLLFPALRDKSGRHAISRAKFEKKSRMTIDLVDLVTGEVILIKSSFFLSKRTSTILFF